MVRHVAGVVVEKTKCCAMALCCGGCVLWCGVVWCGVVWCGVVVVWCGVVWCGAVRCGVVCCHTLLRHGTL